MQTEQEKRQHDTYLHGAYCLRCMGLCVKKKTKCVLLCQINIFGEYCIKQTEMNEMIRFKQI